ncbi:MAG: hypothetical protein ACI4AK_05945 [Lepagella sp.]
MMEGRLYIDGKDAYSTWGVYVATGGWNDLIAYPPLKKVTSNDWQEEDGIEPDLSNPKLDTKDVQIKMVCSDPYRLADFVDMLSDGSYHTFNCASIMRQYTLRLTQMPNLDYATHVGMITLKMSNDFPLQGYSYLTPMSIIAESTDYCIDGTPLTDYGCRILKGSLSEVLKAGNVKPNLLRNIDSQSGAIYDGANVTYKSKDVKLNCLMRAGTLDELWRNYDALLYDLTRPEERMLQVEELGRSFPFHYKSASVSAFYPTDKIWLTFTLTITFTRDFRI